jgi:hypothetical protein
MATKGMKGNMVLLGDGKTWTVLVVVVVCAGLSVMVVVGDQESVRLDTSFANLCISRSQRCSERQEWRLWSYRV